MSINAEQDEGREIKIPGVDCGFCALLPDKCFLPNKQWEPICEHYKNGIPNKICYNKVICRYLTLKETGKMPFPNNKAGEQPFLKDKDAYPPLN